MPPGGGTVLAVFYVFVCVCVFIGQTSYLKAVCVGGSRKAGLMACRDNFLTSDYRYFTISVLGYRMAGKHRERDR